MSSTRRIRKAVAQREIEQRKLEGRAHRLVSIALRHGRAEEAAVHLAEAPPRYRAAVAVVSLLSRLGAHGA